MTDRQVQNPTVIGEAVVEDHDVYRETIEIIRSQLSRDLLRTEFKRQYRKGEASFPAGHSYIASEALYHICNGRDTGIEVRGLQHEGRSHWFLIDREGTILDPTADQFDEPVPYDDGRPRKFMSTRPSTRCRKLLNHVSAEWRRIRREDRKRKKRESAILKPDGEPAEVEDDET